MSQALQARALLATWRERGADRHDPVQFRFMEALERRAARYDGEARRLLDERLARATAAYADALAHASADPAAAHADAPAGSPLAALLDYIVQHTRTQAQAPVGPGAATSVPMPKEVEVLEHFREIWQKVSSEKQLRESLERVPGNAGPLNSHSLVYRSLALMHEVSPAYLRQFLAYIDALSWLEQFQSGALGAGDDAPRAASGKKGTQSKAR